MAKAKDVDYASLAARLADPNEVLPAPGSVLTGDDAARYGREFLLREYGSDEAIRRAMRPGRPIVGTPKQGPSPVVRGVIPVEEFDALNTLAERSGKGRSELVRQSVHDLLVAEKLVG